MAIHIYGNTDSAEREKIEQVNRLTNANLYDLISESPFENILDEFSEKEKESLVSIEELELSKRSITELNKLEIYTIADLQATTREKLRSINKFLGLKTIAEIANALLKRDLHLASDDIYICSKCSEKFADEITRASTHFCPYCQAKIDRISEISDISVTLSQPEYSDYETIGKGMVIYANITNNTYGLMKIRVCDFFIVIDGQQRSPKYFLSGYNFVEENVLPMSTRTCAKIWSRKELTQETLKVSDYAVLTLQNTKKHIFKFVFNGENWDIDDYFAQ